MYKCLLCNKTKFDKVLDLNNIPSGAQVILNKNEIVNDTSISSSLVKCNNCGLVQLNTTPVSYYKDVIRASSVSSTLKEIRLKQYKELIDNYNLKGKKIIEIGCAKGEFLELFNDFDINAYGIENNKDFVKIAKSKGLNVYKDFINSKNHIIKNSPFDAFLSFNVLEHMPYPNTILKGIFNNLTDNGIGLIAVPSAEYIINTGVYYELIRDHLAYYSRDTFRMILENNGFVIEKEELINRDTLTFIVSKRKELDYEKICNSFNTINNEIDYLIDHLGNKTLSIWGASHQCFTILSTTKLHEHVQYIVDSAEYKQNKYSPVSHIKIVSPEYFFSNPTDYIIIIAPGFAKEIKKIIQNNNNSVKILVLMTDKIEGDLQ